MFRLINKAIGYLFRKSPVLIHTPRAESIGNCAEEIFFGLLKAKREGKKILFLHPRNLFFRRFVANQKLFHLQSPYSIQNKYLWYLGGWLLTLIIALMWLGTGGHIMRLRRILRSIWNKSAGRKAVFDFDRLTPTVGKPALWNPGGFDCFSWKVVEEQSWRKQFDGYVPPEMMAYDHRRAEHLRVKMGIPLADWFVCLHVREAGYREDINNPRNASIQNYIEGIKVITAAGGRTVRLGDRSMTPLPPMDRVIDYPHTGYKSELMDIYLLNQCRFYVGGTSGPLEVANLFSKPMVLVNVTGWSMALPVDKGDLTILKHVFSRARNRFLSISEILSEPPTWQGIDLASNEYVMVENTPAEIRDVIDEYLAKSEYYEYSRLQEAFNEGRKNQIHRWFDQMGATSADLTETYRIAARCDSSAATLGQNYLEQNWLVDNLGKTSFEPLA